MALRDISEFKPSRRVKLLKGIHWLSGRIASLLCLPALVYCTYLIYCRFSDAHWPEVNTLLALLLALCPIAVIIQEAAYNRAEKRGKKEIKEFGDKNLLERLRPPSFIRNHSDYVAYEYAIYCRPEDVIHFNDAIGSDSIKKDGVPIRTKAISKEHHRRIKMLAYEEEIPFHGRYVEIHYVEEEMVSRVKYVFASFNGQYCSCPEYFSYNNPAVPVLGSGEIPSDKVKLAHDFLKLRKEASEAINENRDGELIS